MGTQFGISTVFDRQWLPAWNVGGDTIPPFGAVVATSRSSSGNETVLTVRKTTAGDFLRYPIMLNGPWEIASGRVGNVTSADKPARGLSNVVVGSTCGTVPGSYLLFPRLPGLQSVGSGYFTRGQCHGQFWAVAASDWVNRDGNQSYCTASPCLGQFASDTYGILFPLFLPRNGQSKDPNVKAGNILPWTLSVVGGVPVAVATNHLDEEIGTIRIVSSGSLPPQGWRLYDFGARLLRGGSNGGTGGSTNHDHGTVTVHSWFAMNDQGDVVSDMPTADNVPEYGIATFLERFE